MSGRLPIAATGLVILASLLTSNQASGHRCGASEITVRVGECVSWEITADVSESQPSDYGLPSPPGANAASRPGDPNLMGFPFSKYHLGVYRICGTTPGVTSMTAAWAYAPTMGAGNCPVSITVLAASSAPTSTADETDSGEDADPVNTYSGELFQLYPPDIRLEGPLPLEFQRYYSSGLATFDGQRGRLGDGWRTNLGMGLTGDSTRIDIDFRFGQRIQFSRSGPDWLLIKPLDGRFQLKEAAGDYVLMDPSDQKTYRFSSDGRLRSIADRNGNALDLGYPNGGIGQVPDSLSDGLGRSLGMTVSSFQFYSQVTDGTRNASFSTSVFFGADEASQLSAATNTEGETDTYAYLDPGFFTSGLMTQTTREQGNVPLVTTWSGVDRVATQTDAGTGVWTFAYAAPDTTVTDPLGQQTVHTHDAAGRQTGITNPDLDLQLTSYDGNGRRGSVVDFLGRSHATTYDGPSGQIRTFTDQTGEVITYSYAGATDALGFTYHDLSDITFGDGRSWSFARDAAGNVTGYTEPGGGTWTTTYNGRGQPLTVQNPLAGTETRSYRADGMLQTRTDRSGNVTTYAYDGLWRLQSVSHQDGSSRSFTRDNMDRLLTMVDELGHTTSLQYDGNGRLVQQTDAGSNVRTYTYDDADRIATATDGLGQTRTMSYDLAGRPATESLANGETVGFAYSTLGFPSQVTLPSGDSWLYSHDALGRLTSTTSPLSEVTGFDHDGFGRVTAISWPAGGTSRFTYDAMSRPLTETDAEGRTTSYRYDSNGRLAGIDVDAIGLASTHNAVGLLTAIADPLGADWVWTYDSAGRLISSTDPGSDTITYTYDNRNRYDVITLADGSTQTHTYDARGHVTQRRGFDGVGIDDIDFSYDTLGRLSGGTALALGYDAEGRMTSSNGILVNRQLATGRVSSVVYASGPTVTYTYDSGGRLSQIDDGLGGQTMVATDADGRITGLSRPNGVSSSWTFDANGRVQRIQHAAFVDIQLTRDLSGFIVSASREQPTHFDVVTATENQSVNTSLEIVGVTHDAQGAVTAMDGIGFDRDPFQRATSRTSGGTDALAWDALGHLVSHGAGGAQIGFAWNYGFAQPTVGSSTAMGSPQWHYVSLPDGRLLYRINGAQRQYYHCDELGNVLAITNDAGVVVASYGYSPYGRRTEDGGIAGSVDANPFTWGGEHFVISDSVARLYVMGERLYDANRARFLSRDRSGPWLNPLAFNPYGYAAANPLYFIDPWGGNPQQPPAAQGPSGLDIVSEGLSVIGAGGTVQGVLEEAAKTGLNNARETTAPLARQLASGGQSASSARGAFNQAASAQNSAQRTLTQSTSRGMKALGNLGNAATFFGGLIEAYKLNGKLNQHESDWSRTVQKALRSSQIASENAFRSYKEGNISYEQLRQRLDGIKQLLDDQMAAEDDLYTINVWISGSDAFFNFGMGLAPGGDKLYSGLKSVLGVNTESRSGR